MNDLMTLLEAAETTDTTETLALGGIFGALAGIAIITMVIALVIGILTLIANWRIFKKAGQKGWKVLIPIYNSVILFRIAGISPWWLLVFLAGAIPVVGTLAVLALVIYLNIMLAKAFGKGAGFTVGLILLNTIFTLILGFGSAEYQLNKSTPDVVEEN